MKRALLLFAAAVLVAGEVIVGAGPAQAAGSVTILTIPTKTSPYAGTIVVRPNVTKTGGVRYASRRLNVTRSGKYVGKNVPSVTLKPGNYWMSTIVKYRVLSGGTYGSIQSKVKAQRLIVKEAAPPVVSDPVNTSPTSTEPCGSQTILKSDGTPWQCTFSEEFLGTTLNSNKWTAQQTDGNGLHGGIECLVNSPRNISVSGGLLHLTVRKETSALTCKSPYGSFRTQYTGGGIDTWNKFEQTYGRFEFRAKFPSTSISGLQSSLWLYPKTMTYGDWPNSGEIDVAESFSQYADRAIPYIHYISGAVPAPGETGVTNWYCMLAPGAFHTYTAEWSPTTITIKYDGTTCLVHTINSASPLTGAAPFDQPFAVVLTQVLGGSTNLFDSAQTPLPATTEVDYVRVWE